MLTVGRVLSTVKVIMLDDDNVFSALSDALTSIVCTPLESPEVPKAIEEDVKLVGVTIFPSYSIVYDEESIPAKPLSAKVNLIFRDAPFIKSPPETVEYEESINAEGA